MKLSIIIPVYNTGKYLRRCVESILKQELRDCELLLIDDGSTDNSGETADAIAATDGRISVMHKTNGGPSTARNIGLDRAKGEYITFIDSDDEIAPDTLRPLIDTLDRNPGYDIIEYTLRENVGRQDERPFILPERIYSNAIEWLADGGLRHCWMCNKIFRRKLFGHTRFDPAIKHFEDMRIMGELISTNPVIATTSHGTYLYRWNDSGLMASIVSHTGLLREQMRIMRMFGIDTRQAKWHSFYMDMFNIQLYVYMQTGEIMLEGQRVVPRPYGGLQGLVKSLALDILGLRLSCRIFKLFKKGL